MKLLIAIKGEQMQSLTLLTELQRKFLVQLNSFHQSIDDRQDKYQLGYIVNLRIDKAARSLIVTYKNNEVFNYCSYGTITQIK